MWACLISNAQNYVCKFLATLLGNSLPFIYSFQERIFNKLSMATRKNMITFVAFKSNKATNSSRWHTIEYFPTLSLKTKSIIELYAQTELTLKLTSTSNTRARELAPKLKPQVTPLQKSSGVHGIFFETQRYFGNSLMETFPFQSLSKALGFGTISLMMTGTTSLDNQMATLTKIIEGLLTSLKKKDHDICKVDEQTREHEWRRLNLSYQGFSSRSIRCH